MELRKLEKNDLTAFRFQEDKCCDNCQHVGSYRTTDFYLCEKCMFDIVRLEVSDDN